ncbi:Ulp1-like peptidase [Cucumis melo var. makuwa]|uniref:Ulp1-like peptidase n=1 Tax=Cucumis melo var. makuwa TaxID=1194695 RepID=A0A5D3DIG2_CUCMM|nr:Ulp1-like peptidase [Cucumis melo var. makuwa]TYK23365.1 Ulp1-like peptidase [Cucumis melo var. makuwa]
MDTRRHTTTHLNLWTEEDLEYYFNTAVGDFQDKPGWGDVNYVIGCINIREHWLAVAANMRTCKIYVSTRCQIMLRRNLLIKLLKCLHDASPHSQLYILHTTRNQGFSEAKKDLDTKNVGNKDIPDAEQTSRESCIRENPILEATHNALGVASKKKIFPMRQARVDQTALGIRSN